MISLENKMNTKKYYKVFFFDEETKTISAQGNATFEVGRVYDKNLPLEKLKLCSNTVYHFCKNIENTWGHYDFAENCVFGEIEVLGHLLENTVNHFDIFASDKIKVTKILTWEEIIALTTADSKLHQFAKQKLQSE